VAFAANTSAQVSAVVVTVSCEDLQSDGTIRDAGRCVAAALSEMHLMHPQQGRCECHGGSGNWMGGCDCECDGFVDDRRLCKSADRLRPWLDWSIVQHCSERPGAVFVQSAVCRLHSCLSAIPMDDWQWADSDSN
jgi:hypothetical protein